MQTVTETVITATAQATHPVDVALDVHGHPLLDAHGAPLPKEEDQT